MLAEEFDLNFLPLINSSCWQTEVFQVPALNKHKLRYAQSMAATLTYEILNIDTFKAMEF
jgi:hypothetical protein